jgi:hypothetical protein
MGKSLWCFTGYTLANLSFRKIHEHSLWCFTSYTLANLSFQTRGLQPMGKSIWCFSGYTLANLSFRKFHENSFCCSCKTKHLVIRRALIGKQSIWRSRVLSAVETLMNSLWNKAFGDPQGSTHWKTKHLEISSPVSRWDTSEFIVKQSVWSSSGLIIYWKTKHLEISSPVSRWDTSEFIVKQFFGGDPQGSTHWKTKHLEISSPASRWDTYEFIVKQSIWWSAGLNSLENKAFGDLESCQQLRHLWIHCKTKHLVIHRAQLIGKQSIWKSRVLSAVETLPNSL